MSNYSHSLIKRLNGINIQVEFLLLCIDLSFGKYKNFFLKLQTFLLFFSKKRYFSSKKVFTLLYNISFLYKKDNIMKLF